MPLFLLSIVLVLRQKRLCSNDRSVFPLRKWLLVLQQYQAVMQRQLSALARCFPVYEFCFFAELLSWGRASGR